MDAKIAPSILSADILHLERDIRELESNGADWLHIDIMDGHFVPNLTFGPHILSAVRSVTKLPLDVHLMIEKPEEFIDMFAEAGADLISVQVESTPHIHGALQSIRQKGLKAGVVINPGTSIDVLQPLLPYVDLVLIMTVNPGFGGQAFIDTMIDKVSKVKQMKTEGGFSFSIEVDGGIIPETAKRCFEAGADVFVAGSYIFKENKIQEQMDQLREAISSSVD